MLIKKVTRSYSKSINARNYGAAESWVKVESIYEAEVESGDNPMEVSKLLFDQCKKEVIADCNDIVAKMKGANQTMRNGMNTTTTPSTSPSATAGGPTPAVTSTTPRSL